VNFRYIEGMPLAVTFWTELKDALF